MWHVLLCPLPIAPLLLEAPTLPAMGSFVALACSLLWLSYMALPSSAQPGFINIDCGGVEDFTSKTGLTWVTDEGYISTGKAAVLPDPYNNLSTALQTVRYFPEESVKSCYELSPVTVDVGYIVRAVFYYGDYDGKGSMPTFALIIDATVMQDPVSDDSQYDMYVLAKSTTISVCLARSVSVSASTAGDPFISYLQLITIPPGTSYNSVALDNGYGLYSKYTINLGSTNSSSFSYPNDTMDRSWLPFASSNNLETGHVVTVDAPLIVDYAPPLMLQTATTDLFVPYPLTDVFSTRNYHILLFFAEINPNVTAPGQRVFDIYSNIYKGGLEPWEEGLDVFNMTGGNFKGLEIFSPTPVTPINDSILITFKPSANSTYGPLICGIQVLLYTNEPLSNLTYFVDVSAIQRVRDDYAIPGSDGDPCLPMSYSWSWIQCENEKSLATSNITRISSIFLSNMALKSNISNHFAGLSGLIEIYLDHNQLKGPIPDLSVLSNLQTLDLQNNNLSGTIPTWLGTMSNLKNLFLQNNNLEGDIPRTLLEKAANNELNFTYSGNVKLTCNGQPCDVLASPPQNMTPSPSPKNVTSSPSPPIVPQNVSIFLMMFLLSFFYPFYN